MRRLARLPSRSRSGLSPRLSRRYRWVYLETGKRCSSTVMEFETERRALLVTGSAPGGPPALPVGDQAARATRSGRSGWRGPTCRPYSLSSRAWAASWYDCPGCSASSPSRVLTAGLYLLWLVLDPSAGGEARFRPRCLPILTQQVSVFVRCLIKVGYYAGISEALTRTHSPEYAYAPAAAAALGATVPQPLRTATGTNPLDSSS